MNKILIALVGSFCFTLASAQVDKAASEATDSVKHKIDQKSAESDAKKSGPIGKTVNNVKADYHKSQSKSSSNKAKKALKNAG